MRRQHVFDAILFGALLPAEVWERVSESDTLRLIEAAPCCNPGRHENIELCLSVLLRIVHGDGTPVALSNFPLRSCPRRRRPFDT